MVRQKGRFGASAASFAAIVLAVAAVAAVAFLSFSAQPPPTSRPGVVTGGTTTATVPSGGAFESAPSENTTSQSATTTSTASYTSSAPCATAVESFGNITITVGSCLSYTLNLNSELATLESPQVQAYIDGAYHYSVAFVATSKYVPYAEYGILNVTGSQVVTGNWSTGYEVSYVENKMVNVTVQDPDTTSSKVVRAFSVDLPDRSYARAFTQDQQAAIGTALANQSVVALMTDPPYFVDSVGPFPAENQTFGEDFFIRFYQVNGVRTVNAFVNEAGTAVVGLYVDGLTSTTCNESGACYTDPWGLNPDAGRILAPFIFTVAYPGNWALSVVGSDNASGISEPFAFNSTFTGTGNTTVTVPWFSDTGWLTVMATAQKSDGGSATLSLTISWAGTPTTRSTGPGQTSARVSDSITA
ncbi:MAG: hypothetical protein OK442_07525 [Thaumarchaeota archaeon]|nr:hypothetical protein [Nitrososphaerota archaeon]